MAAASRSASASAAPMARSWAASSAAPAGDRGQLGRGRQPAAGIGPSDASTAHGRDRRCRWPGAPRPARCRQPPRPRGPLELHLQPGDLGHQRHDRRDRPRRLDHGGGGRVLTGRFGQHGQPRLQPGPTGVRLGHQGGALQGCRRCLVPVLGGGRPGLRVRARGARLLEQGRHPARGVGRVQVRGEVGAGRLGEPGQHLRQPLVDLVEGAAGLLPAGDQPALDRGEAAGVEEALEQRPAPLRRRPAGTSANCPCGSSTTWQNWARLSPSKRVDQVPGLVEPGGQRCASRRRCAPRGAPWPARSSCRCRAAWAAPRPATGSLGAAGRAGSPRARPRARTPSAAWSLRRPRAVPRSPGTWP